MITYSVCCDICGAPYYQEFETRKELRDKTKEEGWLRKRKHRDTKYLDVCSSCAITYDSDYNYEEDDEVRVPIKPLRIV